MSTEPPWTIGRLLDWTMRYFQGKGIESPRLEAELLLAHSLGCPRIILYTRHTEEPPEAERARFRALVKKRLEGAPVAHLLGRKEFFSLEFEVGPAVLVPRPDSEWLVTECLDLIKPMPTPRVLDVGTGSGCLAIALACRHKMAELTAIDLSSEALEVARRNAEKHRVGERIRFLPGDLFAPLAGEGLFDVIVSNPPYIPRAEIASLAPEVRDHEPRLALDGGEDGFVVLDRLFREAPRHLASGGRLLVEIGHDQEAGVLERLAQKGTWEHEKTIPDGAGHPRVIRARKK